MLSIRIIDSNISCPWLTIPVSLKIVNKILRTIGTTRTAGSPREILFISFYFYFLLLNRNKTSEIATCAPRSDLFMSATLIEISVLVSPFSPRGLTEFCGF